MGILRELWALFTCFLLCACAVVLGTLLYPFVLLFFSLIALAHHLLRRVKRTRSSSRRFPPERSGA